MMYIVSGFLLKSMNELKREIFWRHWVLWDIVSDPFIHPGGKDDSAQLHQQEREERSDFSGAQCWCTISRCRTEAALGLHFLQGMCFLKLLGTVG